MKKRFACLFGLVVLLGSPRIVAAQEDSGPFMTVPSPKGDHKVMMVGPNCDPSESAPRPRGRAGELSGTLSVSTSDRLLHGVIVSAPILTPSQISFPTRQEGELRKYLQEIRNVIFEGWQEQTSEQEQFTLQVVLHPPYRVAVTSTKYGTPEATLDPAMNSELSSFLVKLKFPPPPAGINIEAITFNVTAAVDKERFPRKNALELGCIAVLQNGRELTVQSHGGTTRLGKMTNTSVQCIGQCNSQDLSDMIRLVESGKPVRKGMAKGMNGGGITISGGGSITVSGGGSINVGRERD